MKEKDPWCLLSFKFAKVSVQKSMEGQAFTKEKMLNQFP